MHSKGDAPWPARTVARIDYFDSENDKNNNDKNSSDKLPALLSTSVSGTLEPITPAAIRRALWRYPAMTLGVVARIHWQAFKLFVRRVPFFKQPVLPSHFVTR